MSCVTVLEWVAFAMSVIENRKRSKQRESDNPGATGIYL